MSYEQVKVLRPAEFKRYCGVEPETFRRMVEVFAKHPAKKRLKSGRPTRLSVEQQMLLTLEYWREYRRAVAAQPAQRLSTASIGP